MFGVHENPKIRPQIRKFGQMLSCDFQKRKYFGFFAPFPFISISVLSGDTDREFEVR